LALEAYLVDQDASISLQSSKSAHEVLIDALDFADGAGVLQLGDCVLLDCENDAVVSHNGNSGVAAIDSLKGVLHLEELAVG